MKTIILTILTAIFLSSCVPLPAQTPMKTKKIESTIVPDSTKIYTGAKGGRYFWKISIKTGKPYKHYLKNK